MFHCGHIPSGPRFAAATLLSVLASCTFERAPLPAGPAPVASDAGAAPDVRMSAAVSGGSPLAVTPSAAGMDAPPPAAVTVASPAATAPAMTAAVDAGMELAAPPACTLDFSACPPLDPVAYTDCVRVSLERCGLPAADGGAVPSAECLLQKADCIARSPQMAVDCMAQSCPPPQ